MGKNEYGVYGIRACIIAVNIISNVSGVLLPCLSLPVQPFLKLKECVFKA